jgi:hypothetical protein
VVVNSPNGENAVPPSCSTPIGTPDARARRPRSSSCRMVTGASWSSAPITRSGADWAREIGGREQEDARRRSTQALQRR